MTLTAKRITSKSEQDKEIWFESTFQEHWQRVYGVLYHLVGDRDEAEDLALETFYRLHQKSPRFESEHRLKGWLYRVATNLGFNALRAHKRRQRYEDEAGHIALANEPPLNPETEIERIQEQERVRATLAQMKPHSAKLLILRHSGLSYAEIATTLGIALGSVGTLLARAERAFETSYRRLEGD